MIGKFIFTFVKILQDVGRHFKVNFTYCISDTQNLCKLKPKFGNNEKLWALKKPLSFRFSRVFCCSLHFFQSWLRNDKILYQTLQKEHSQEDFNKYKVEFVKFVRTNCVESVTQTT